MAKLSNKSTTATTSTVEKKTNYSEKRFDGVKYQTVELAVQAGAKSYALADLGKTQEILTELKLEVSDADLIQAIYNVKKQQIVAIVEKHTMRDQVLDNLDL